MTMRKPCCTFYFIFSDSLRCLRAMESIIIILAFAATVIAVMYVASTSFRELSLAVSILILCALSGKFVTCCCLYRNYPMFSDTLCFRTPLFFTEIIIF